MAAAILGRDLELELGTSPKKSKTSSRLSFPRIPSWFILPRLCKYQKWQIISQQNEQSTPIPQPITTSHTQTTKSCPACQTVPISSPPCSSIFKTPANKPNQPTKFTSALYSTPQSPPHVPPPHPRKSSTSPPLRLSSQPSSVFVRSSHTSKIGLPVP